MTVQDAPVMVPVPAPDVISSYGHGWRMLWKMFGWLLLILLLVYAIAWAVQLPFNLLQSYNPSFVWGFITFLISLFGLAPFSYSLSYAYLKAARGEQVAVTDMFAAYKNYWNTIAATLLTGVIIVIGFIFLIVPGIYFACKLAFVPYLVVDKKMNAVDAIGTSWKMTNGYFWQVFLIGLLAIPITILGLICFVVGLIISIMWIYTAQASLYYAVDARRSPPVTTPPAGSSPIIA